MNKELWAKACELAKDAPYIFSSPYYAHKGAAQEIASKLSTKEAKSFLDYALKQYKSFSNYAGD